MDFKSSLTIRILKYASVATVIAGAYSAQPYRPIVFLGNSMTPTYSDKEVAVASTQIDELFRGDVVVINGAGGPFVKRIAFLPGDEIDFHYFGGEWMMGNSEVFKRLNRPDRYPHRVYRVPPGHVFVLGDNWTVSVDSRQLGAIPISSIRAKLTEPKPPSPASSGSYRSPATM
jgi:signal peptidase I